MRQGLARVKEIWAGKSGASLLSRSLEGGSLILLAELYSNGLRLASNLILTRLLYPEAFGLMLIVTLVFIAFDLFSDIGIKNAIIVRKDTIDERYLRTAWTLSILRGLILSVLGVLLAEPIAAFYGDPTLVGLILLMSVSPLLSGLMSPMPMIYEKQVRFGRVVFLTAASQTIATIMLVTAVWISPQIWWLALHGPVTALIRAVLSFVLFEGFSPKLAWDRAVVLEIFHFGKWIVVGTALTFLSRQGDALIVSKFSTAEQLGVFGIALTFAKLAELLVERLSWSLLFPVYVELREKGVQHFNASLQKIKLGLFALCSPLLILFTVGGRDFIRLLYDPRYHAAGGILEVLAVGAIFFVAGGALINIPMAFSDSQRHMWLQFFRFVTLLGTLLVGATLGGFTGLLLSIPVAQAIFYPVLVACTFKYGVRGYLLDVMFALALCGVVAVAWSLRGFPLVL